MTNLLLYFEDKQEITHHLELLTAALAASHLFSQLPPEERSQLVIKQFALLDYFKRQNGH